MGALTRFTESPIFTRIVNNHELVKIEGNLAAEALRILRETPGVTVIAEPGGADRGIDAILQFADNRTPIAVEFKREANAATAWQLVQRAQARPNLPLLLIAGKTTAEARKILEDHGIAVIDHLGNAHIELPGLLMHLEGHRPPPRTNHTIPPTRLKGKAGLAALALLLHPERAWQVKDLAKEAKISAALAHRVLTRLEGEGIIAVEGTGPNRLRRVTNPAALLDLWTEENDERPTRLMAHLLAQTPQQLMGALGASLQAGGVEYALTGAAAASMVAPFITALPVVDVWIAATTAPEDLLDAAGARPVTEGPNVVFLQAKNDAPLAFRERLKDLWVVNRFRLYADLRRDPRRGREQAEHLRQEVIGF